MRSPRWNWPALRSALCGRYGRYGRSRRSREAIHHPHAGWLKVSTKLITGKWADIGKVKGPVLRGPSRAPYFHNGSAASLADVISFYNVRFGIGFTAQEQADLVAFLNTL